MNPGIYNYKDSIANPNGHFRTLNNVFALRNDCGEPLFTVTSKIARFRVELNGRRSSLYCFLGDANTARSRYKNLALQMECFKSEFLTWWQYMENEMLVFDERGRSQSCDIVVQDEPHGEFLDDFIHRCCKQNDSKSLRRLFAKVCDMSEDFYEKGFVHRAITPSNIIVTSDATPVMINYMSSYVICNEGVDHERISIDDDNMNLAILAIILFVVSMQPSLYAEFRGIMMFSRPNFQSILPRLYNLAGKADIAPMKKMVEAVLSANDRLKDRKKLNRYLKELSESNACVGSDEKGANLAYYPKTDGVQRVWSNPISDNLICSKGSDDMWRYYNKDGSQAFEGVFHRAEDFMEGRAEVTVGYYQGLINRSGEFIIDAVCEEVRWYGDNGVALVTIDGVMELRDRNSNVVKRLDCDWVGVLYNGLFPAKSDAKYGYIDLKGDTVIEFIYDEAFSFNNGRALVIKDNCECYIDTCGNRINV